MKEDYLMEYMCLINSGLNLKYLFRSNISIDLKPYYGRRQFQIFRKMSMVIDTLTVSLSQRTKLEVIYNEVCGGMKSLNLKNIKNIYRIELRK
jgi:hypothetical protein